MTDEPPRPEPGRDRAARAMTGAQLACLRWLDARGGSAGLDKHSRAVAGGETRPQGSWQAWLRLVADGLVVGSKGRLLITAQGYCVLRRESAP